MIADEIKRIRFCPLVVMRMCGYCVDVSKYQKSLYVCVRSKKRTKTGEMRILCNSARRISALLKGLVKRIRKKENNKLYVYIQIKLAYKQVG